MLSFKETKILHPLYAAELENGVISMSTVTKPKATTEKPIITLAVKTVTEF